MLPRPLASKPYFWSDPTQNTWGYVLVVYTSLYESYHLPYSNIGHRDPTLPLTEARTEMIHDQLESYSSMWRAYPNLSHP